jgi:hypothetical protein
MRIYAATFGVYHNIYTEDELPYWVNVHVITSCHRTGWQMYYDLPVRRELSKRVKNQYS